VGKHSGSGDGTGARARPATKRRWVVVTAIAGVAAVAAAAGVVLVHSEGRSAAHSTALSCSAQFRAWKPDAVRSLNGITDFDGKAMHATSAAQQATSVQSQARDDMNADVAMTFVGALAKIALKAPPPACMAQLRAAWRTAMSDYVQASQDSADDNTAGVTASLISAASAENQAADDLGNGA
jgi:hypothetical protein